jgi:hypothetical protein
MKFNLTDEDFVPAKDLQEAVSRLPLELRLAGLTTEDIGAYYSQTEIWAELTPDERSTVLTLKQRMADLKLVEKIKGLKPEEIVKSLKIEELRRLKELLDNIDLD